MKKETLCFLLFLRGNQEILDQLVREVNATRVEADVAGNKRGYPPRPFPLTLRARAPGERGEREEGRRGGGKRGKKGGRGKDFSRLAPLAGAAYWCPLALRAKAALRARVDSPQNPFSRGGKSAQKNTLVCAQCAGTLRVLPGLARGFSGLTTAQSRDIIAAYVLVKEYNVCYDLRR